MRWFAVFLWGALAGCSAPDMQVEKRSGIVDVGKTSFAVFSDGGTATAVYVRSDRPDTLEVFAKMALRAIAYTTRCDVAQDSFETDGRSVTVALNCLKNRVNILNLGEAGRRLSALNLPEISEELILRLGQLEGDFAELGHP